MWNFILEMNLQHLRVVVCLRWVQITEGHTFTGGVCIWEKQRREGHPVNIKAQILYASCHIRQGNLCSLSCALPSSHSIGSDCQHLFLKEETEKPRSFSLPDIMPVKHIASFNKNGFGKHSDLINFLFYCMFLLQNRSSSIGQEGGK